jgi:hypothetical protein
MAVACGAGIGLRIFLQLIFPPKLECGDPYFVLLKLDDSEVRPPAETDSTEAPNPGEDGRE